MSSPERGRISLEESKPAENENVHENRQHIVMEQIFEIEEAFLDAYATLGKTKIDPAESVQFDIARRLILANMRRMSSFARRAAGISDEQWIIWFRATNNGDVNTPVHGAAESFE